MLARKLLALAALVHVAAAADTCQPDWVYSLGLKPRWELPRGSCLPAFTTFGEFIRATDFTNEDQDDRDPAKARRPAADCRRPVPHSHSHPLCAAQMYHYASPLACARARSLACPARSRGTWAHAA